MAEEKEQECLRLGLLGASWIAPRAVIEPASKAALAKHIKVVSVASRDHYRASSYAKEHGLPGTHESYKSMLEDPDIDAVYIGLPNSEHCKWACAALEAGKHVLCEKPLASNADECKKMQASAAKSGKLLMGAYHHLYHPMASRLKHLIESRIGDIKGIVIKFNIPIFRGTDIRYNFDLGGGALMDTGCYVVSYLQYLLGKDETESLEVMDAHCSLAYPQVDQSTTAFLKTKSGVNVRLECSIFSLIPNVSLRVVGANGVEVHATNFVAPHMMYNKVSMKDVKENWVTEKFPRDISTYQHQLHAFVTAIHTADYDVVSNPSFCYTNLAIIDTIYRTMGLARRGTNPLDDSQQAVPDSMAANGADSDADDGS